MGAARRSAADACADAAQRPRHVRARRAAGAAAGRPRVVDQTGTLSAAQVQALTAKLAAIETQRGAQLLVVIVPSTQPEDIATYGQRVADTWMIGRRDVGDGLVIVVAKNDRRINIEVAKTLEGAIPDVLAGRIINEQIKPAFKAGDYAGGLNAAIDKLGARIAGEALPEPTRNSSAERGGGMLGRFDLQDLARLCRNSVTSPSMAFGPTPIRKPASRTGSLQTRPGL